MINGIQPTFTGKMPLQSGKTILRSLNKVSEQPMKTNLKPQQESFGKNFLNDMLYGFEIMADLFKIKL